MKTILMALGGNAISPPGEEGNISQQFAHASESMTELVNVVREHRYDRVIVTHGNGPQVGNILLRSEIAAAGGLYPLPLDTCVSDSEGGMGYMLQQVLHNVLVDAGMDVPVVCVLTQTVVGDDDPAWQNPTKFIGQYYSEEDAQKLMAQRGWRMKADSNRGWRRVVPSPKPLEIVELASVRALVAAGVWVIAAGGGGIPVRRDAKNHLHGVEAVVDKDLASALLARQLNVDLFTILTGVEQVSINYGKPDEQRLDRLSAAQARAYHTEGQFPAGSMGPKIEAALEFAESGDGEALITAAETLGAALSGKTGTWISR